MHTNVIVVSSEGLLPREVEVLIALHACIGNQDHWDRNPVCTCYTLLYPRSCAYTRNPAHGTPRRGEKTGRLASGPCRTDGGIHRRRPSCRDFGASAGRLSAGNSACRTDSQPLQLQQDQLKPLLKQRRRRRN